MNATDDQTPQHDQERSLTLVEILNIASRGYTDDFLKEYYNEETGEINRDGSGDTLAEFIVLEIKDTFDASLSKTEQLDEVCRVLRRAMSDLQRVIEAVQGSSGSASSTDETKF